MAPGQWRLFELGSSSAGAHGRAGAAGDGAEEAGLVAEGLAGASTHRLATLFSAQFTAGLLASEGALMCPPPSPELGRSPRALCACPPITGPAVQCPPLPWGSVRPQGPASCAQRKQGRARPQLGKPPRGRPARVHWTGILSPQPRAQVERPQASWPERGVQDQNQASHSRKSPALHQWDLGHLGTKEDFQTSQTIFCFQLLNNSTV